MAQIDVEGCNAILQRQRALELDRISAQKGELSKEFDERFKQSIKPTHGMLFMQKLDSMADEIRELVMSAKEIVLYNYSRTVETTYGDDFDCDEDVIKRELHPLFRELGLFAEGDNTMWNYTRLKMFRAWITCRYAGLIEIVHSTPFEEDYYDEEFEAVTLKRAL